MKKPDKLQRNLIYKEALKIYVEHCRHVHPDQRYGICWCIWEAIRFLEEKQPDVLKGIDNTFNISPYIGSLFLYKELSNKRPKNATSYWFPLEDSESRINILNAAILKTNPR